MFSFSSPWFSFFKFFSYSLTLNCFSKLFLLFIHFSEIRSIYFTLQIFTGCLGENPIEFFLMFYFYFISVLLENLDYNRRGDESANVSYLYYVWILRSFNVVYIWGVLIPVDYIVGVWGWAFPISWIFFRYRRSDTKLVGFDDIFLTGIYCEFLAFFF